MSGVGEKLVTKSWMQEIFQKSHILSAGGDALIKWKCSVGPYKSDFRTLATVPTIYTQLCCHLVKINLDIGQHWMDNRPKFALG
jgi:hypothetical protein